MTVKRAKGTNFPYREVSREDLVAGKKLLLVDIRTLIPTHNPEFQGTVIILDDNPVRCSEYGEMLFYHCARPYWKEQCFTLVAELNQPAQCGPYEHRYWVPIDEKRNPLRV